MLWTTPKQPRSCLQTSSSVLGAGYNVFNACTEPVQAPMQLTAVTADKLNTHILKKRANFLLHSSQALGSLTATHCSSQFNPSPHGPRPGRQWWSVRMDHGYNKMRLNTPVHLKNTSASWSPPLCPRPTLRGEPYAWKKSHRDCSSSPEQVRHLQPLLPHPKKGWWPQALRIIMKCMDVAFSPLRQMGICILNYLDNWLVLA